MTSPKAAFGRICRLIRVTEGEKGPRTTFAGGADKRASVWGLVFARLLDGGFYRWAGVSPVLHSSVKSILRHRFPLSREDRRPQKRRSGASVIGLSHCEQILDNRSYEFVVTIAHRERGCALRLEHQPREGLRPHVSEKVACFACGHGSIAMRFLCRGQSDFTAEALALFIPQLLRGLIFFVRPDPCQSPPKFEPQGISQAFPKAM